MANADFSQNKQTAPGGFDAGSYREKAKPEQTVRLTPRQQKLAALEAKLPAALSTRAAALVLSVVVMLAAFSALAAPSCGASTTLPVSGSPQGSPPTTVIT